MDSITDEEFNTSIPGFQNTLRKLTCHLIEVYWFWSRFITTKNYDDEPNFDDLSKDELLKRLQEAQQKTLDLAKVENVLQTHTLQWDKSHQPVITTNENVLFNFVSHCAYHRGQMAVLLRHVGFEGIEETDYNPYIYEQGQK
jgi:uncharacterized damage-inducible protein DinB